jgi:hypothetical protein
MTRDVVVMILATHMANARREGDDSRHAYGERETWWSNGLQPVDGA